MRILGFVLIVCRLISAFDRGISYTKREKVAGHGPIEADRGACKDIPLPPLLGGSRALRVASCWMPGREAGDVSGWSLRVTDRAKSPVTSLITNQYHETRNAKRESLTWIDGSARIQGFTISDQ